MFAITDRIFIVVDIFLTEPRFAININSKPSYRNPRYSNRKPIAINSNCIIVIALKKLQIAS